MPNNANTSVVQIETNKSLGNGTSLLIGGSKAVHSLYVNISAFTLLAGGNRTTRFGAGGLIHFGTDFTSSGNTFTTSQLQYRHLISGIGDLTLRNDGSGTVVFNVANLQNDNNVNTKADSTFTFEGAGDWTFTQHSYLGTASLAADSGFDSNFKLSAVTASNFTGKITYNATRTASLENLTLNGGVFEMNTAIDIGENLTVNNSGSLTGSGAINGNVLINSGGTLRTALTGSVASMRIAGGDLTLNSGANFALRILADGSADTVIGAANEGGDITIPAGILTLGGTFIIDAADIGMIDGIVLYSGFSSVVGDFESVLLNGTGLTSLGGGQWNGEVDGYQVAFDAMSGTFTSAIPEPTTVALLLGAASTALIAVRRRVRR